MSEETQEVTTEETPQEVPKVEQEARAMGWVPKEDFRGDPQRWRPAEEFVERGKNIMPVLRENNERLTGKIADMERTMKEFAEYHSKTEQRAYERAIKEIKTKQREAVRNADEEAFQAAEQEMDELAKQAPQAPQPQQSVEPDPAFLAWHKDNPWYGKDTELSDFAEDLAFGMQQRGKTVDLDKVTERVKAAYPHKFLNPRREQPGAVEGATPSSPKKKGRGYADLPAEAKTVCDRFVKTIPGFTKEQYLKDYDWE